MTTILAAPGARATQEPPRGAELRGFAVRVREDETAADPTSDTAVFLAEGLAIHYQSIEIRADRAVLWIDRDARGLLTGTDRATDGDRLHFGPSAPGPPSRDRPVRLEDDLVLALREIYAEGHVLWKHEASAVTFAEQLYLHLIEQRGIIVEANTFAEVIERGAPLTVQLRAKELRALGPGEAQARGLTLTTCSYAHPHYSIRMRRADVSGRGDSLHPQSATVSSRGNFIELFSFPVLPLPPLEKKLGRDSSLPLKKVQVGQKSRFGAFLFTEWGDEIDSFGQRLHDSFGLDAPFEGDFRLDADWMSERGLGAGSSLSYAGKDLYFGETGGYVVNDQADEDHSLLSTPQPGGMGDPLRFDIDHPLRTKLFTKNRIHPADFWTLDAEVQYFSDENFQQEFFEREFKEEKPPESYAHLVRREDTTRLRVLYRNRLNDFDSQLDSLPSASFEQLAYPLCPIPLLSSAGSESHLVLSHMYEVASLRSHPAEDLQGAGESVLRGDSLLELSTNFDLGPVGIRPFSAGRFTAYDRTVDSQENKGRVAGLAGARAQLPLHRSFDAHSDLFRIDGLRHVMLLDAAYQNVYSVSDASSDFFQLDDTDAVDETESYVLGVRQRFQTHRERSIVNFVDWDTEVELFPDEERDNLVVDDNGIPRARTAGPLLFDLVERPGVARGIFKDLALAQRAEWNLYEDRFDSLSLGLSSRPSPESLLSASYRTRHDKSSVLTGLFEYLLVDRWYAEVLNQWDLRENEILEQRFALTRVGHDFALSFRFERDFGDNESSFTVAVNPVHLWRRRAEDSGGLNRERPSLTDEY